MTELLALAQRALAEARPAETALASVVRERSLVLRFARSRPTQATSVDDVTIELAALRDGHVGRAATNRTDPEALRACAGAAEAAAEEAARASGPGRYPGFPPPGLAKPHHGHDAETARLDPAPGGRALEEAFGAAADAGVEAHGIWTAGEVESAIASGSGTSVSERVTDAFMKAVCIGPDGRSGYAAETATGAGALDPGRIARRAAAKAAAPGEAARLPPGEYPVVLEEHAVGSLLELLGQHAFNGLAFAEERSALSGALGTPVAAPAVNLSDSPRFPGTLPRGFDAEGVPKAPLPLIQDGVAHRVVHDTLSAALAGADSTGHALAAGGSPGGPAPTNLMLAGGGAEGTEELCATIERGVYVTRLWYANVVRPKETLVTAVTRDGTFLIEDGEVTRPLDDMRLTDTMLGLLGRVQALGARPRLTSDGELYGRRFATGVVCPPLRLGAARFTG